MVLGDKGFSNLALIVSTNRTQEYDYFLRDVFKYTSKTKTLNEAIRSFYRVDDTILLNYYKHKVQHSISIIIIINICRSIITYHKCLWIRRKYILRNYYNMSCWKLNKFVWYTKRLIKYLITLQPFYLKIVHLWFVQTQIFWNYVFLYVFTISKLYLCGHRYKFNFFQISIITIFTINC